VASDDGELGEFGRLYAEAERFTRQVANAQHPDARYDGTDETGTVTAVVDGDGRVRDLAVDRSWRQHLGVTELGSAVRGAVERALLARVAGFDAALSEELDAEPPPATDVTPLGDAVRTRLAAFAGAAPEDRVLAASELLAMLETIEQSLDHLSGQLTEQLSRPYTGRSRARHVTVSVTGAAELVGVEYDKRWLVNAHEVNIARETREALTAAYQAARGHGLQDLLADSPLGRAGPQVTVDPKELSRRLGLAPDPLEE